MRAQRGFTLLEMVIVVAILATIAGIVVVSSGGVEEKASLDLARSEMQSLKKAVLQYRADLGALPDAVASLLERPGGAPDWDPDRRRGWRGPYVTREGLATVDGVPDVPVVLDPYGTPYRLEAARLVSAGPNRAFGDVDDLALEVSGP